ncbi:MAG: DNA-binding protein [Enterobacteriaceae bacterium]
MKKEWYATTELTGIGGLPSTIQGINKRAKRESWKSRKRAGVQGKAIEYHIDSLPDATRVMLDMKHMEESSGNYTAQDPLAIWVATYHQLTRDERERLITLVLRHGIDRLLDYLVQED